MAEVTLKGVTIQFPFKPYQVQEDYMEKVIECLQDGKNGVLESPTGTGKTLSLLCSSLAWLMVKKASIQSQIISMGALDQLSSGNSFAENFSKSLNKAGGKGLTQPANSFGWSTPKIIYASRTHSQLSQVMQELKRTSYKHVGVAVLGSRDQLCVNPEVAKEQNSSNKIHLCQAKVKARTCIYYNTVETRKEDPSVKNAILDIEDLVKFGQKYKCCPYFLSRELKQSADIIFMPYNYLLDPKTRKNQGIDLQNNVVLLDEAHNVEKICEEAASLQISSTDIALCIDEITSVMKDLAKDNEQSADSFEMPSNVQKDFSSEDLIILKTIFLELEKAIDSIQITRRDEGDTHPGSYIFELLAKAQITHGKEQLMVEKLDKIVTYLTTTSTSPFARKGNALQKFCDLLRVAFTGTSNSMYRERVKKCYKVYIQPEPPKKTFKNDVWETKKITKSDGKLISYWCFSPGFGMQQLIDQGVRSIVLTSGTLSPMKPFISEIGIDISVQLENPHIVSNKQICVGVVGCGYDGYTLNSSFNTRNDPKYIASLGETIKIFSYILPHGMLIFFPSYPIMKKCQEEWQKMGKWTQIENNKPIFVEPQSKDTFNSIMNDYYKKIHDPAHKGAIFMAVCRGKVSEGLDFANANGRAVLITGLPYPPLKDPRVMLKQRYLDENRVTGKESLSGQQWYQLEASRAVNQAIGRIIRHKNDYGVILLCDCRFDNQSFKQQLSTWIRPHIKKFQDFKAVIKDCREFFRYATANLPQPANSIPISNSDMSLPAVPASFDTSGKRVSNLRSQNSAAATITSKINMEERGDNFDMNLYMPDGAKAETSKEETKPSSPKSLASLLEIQPSKPVLNFATCRLNNVTSSDKTTFRSTNSDLASLLEVRKPVVNSTTTKLQSASSSSVDSISREPAAKRRKMKFTSVNFSENGAEIPSAPELNNTPASQLSILNPSNTQSSSVSSKQEQGKLYIKEVKSRLSKENFDVFKNTINQYQKSGSFDELIVTLRKLFVTGCKEKRLFIGFRTFLKKEHIKSFDEYVLCMGTL